MEAMSVGDLCPESAEGRVVNRIQVREDVKY
jgi:hypothetical protein